MLSGARKFSLTYTCSQTDGGQTDNQTVTITDKQAGRKIQSMTYTHTDTDTCVCVCVCVYYKYIYIYIYIRLDRERERESKVVRSHNLSYMASLRYIKTSYTKIKVTHISDIPVCSHCLFYMLIWFTPHHLSSLPVILPVRNHD